MGLLVIIPAAPFTLDLFLQKLQIALIPARVNMPRGNRFSNSTARFVIVAAARAELTAPEIWTHLREQPGKTIFINIPQGKLAHTRSIHYRSAGIEREHFKVGGCMTTFTNLTLSNGTDSQTQTGLDGV